MWKDLNIALKSLLMSIFLRNGIDNINQMKSMYNQFQNGGPKVKNTDKFYSTMERVAEENNAEWNKDRIRNGERPLTVDEDFVRVLNDNAYDYKGYYDKYPNGDGNAINHWTDEFKTVYHPTFSDESKYSGKKSQYNPYGLPGGFWAGETFIPRMWQVDESNRFADGGIYIKPSHRGRLTELKARTGKTEAELYNDGNTAHKKMVVFARNARKWHDLGGNLSYDDGITYDGGTLPELQVTGYAPIRLTTYYPVVSKYPYTGHSELEVPIDTATWNTYKEDSVFRERISPYLTINKGGSSRDYNLLTNNCADATLSYLNSAFNTKENPILFTTPGDVRDYAINTLGGKVVEGTEDGSDIVLIPRNADNYKQLSEDAVLWHNTHDPHSSGFSFKGPLKYNKRHSLGGSLYPDGGILDNVTRGMQVDTDLCATWSNRLLRNNGYLISGNAWNLNDVDTLFNGFTGLLKPLTYNRKDVEAYNHMASDNVYKNFDSNTLDKTKPYVVNMFYNNSPALKDAYNDGNNVTGTHTGLLTYDDSKKKWIVTHNIHGKIHQENFVPLLSGKGKYGVTAIYQPREDNIFNRVRGFLGFADGGFIDGSDEFDRVIRPLSEYILH